MSEITANKCFHIKLGKKDEWADDSLENGVIYFGYKEIPHAICSTKNEDKIREYIKKNISTNEKEVTNRLHEILYFYDEPETTLWITFHGGYLYYAFAQDEVNEVTKGKGQDVLKCRKTVNGWHKSINEFSLSGGLTSKKYYRRTICKVSEELLKYLLNKINKVPDNDHRKIIEASNSVETLIKRLQPRDFELLIDMILQRSGLIRISDIGGTMKDVDWVGEHPLFDVRYYVQIKSRYKREEFESYKKKLSNFRDNEEEAKVLYFVNHVTPKEKDEVVRVIASQKIAKLTEKLGLVEWVSERT